MGSRRPKALERLACISRKSNSSSDSESVKAPELAAAAFPEPGKPKAPILAEGVDPVFVCLILVFASST